MERRKRASSSSQSAEEPPKKTRASPAERRRAAQKKLKGLVRKINDMQEKWHFVCERCDSCATLFADSACLADVKGWHGTESACPECRVFCKDKGKWFSTDRHERQCGCQDSEED